MRRIKLFGILLSLLAIASLSHAQPETHTIYISFFDGVNNSELTSTFFDMLTEELSTAGITIEIVELSSGLSAVHILFRPVSSRQESVMDKVAYIITLNHNPLIDISPLLIPILRDNAVVFNAPKEIAVKVTAGLLLIENQQCDQANTLFTDLQSQTTESALLPHFPFFIGVCALLADDLATAESIYSNLLQDTLTGTYYVTTPINLAWIYLQTDRPQEALTLVDNLLANYPYWSRDRHDTLARRAEIHAQLGNRDAAFADIDSALQTRPNDFHLLVVRGRIHEYFDESEQALASYTNAITLNPNFAPAYYYRGALYLALGQSQNAQADFQAYLQIAPAGDFSTRIKTALGL